LKAGLRQQYTDEVRIAVDNAYATFSKNIQFEWYTNPELMGNELTPKRVEMV
jgi:hypothetical protein